VKRWAALAAVLLLASLAIAPASAGNSQPTPEDQTALIAAAKVADAEGLADYAGISLTEATARSEDEAATRDIATTLNPDTFTGMYYTQDSTSYTLHIVAKAGTAAARPALPRLNVLRVVYETAPRSRNEMQAISKDIASFDPLGWSAIEPDPATGRVNVIATSATTAEAISKQFGDSVTVTLGAPLTTISCTDRLHCTPSRGGIYIATLSGDPAPLDYEICTFGFKAKNLSNGVIKMLSAGHCNIDVDGGTNVYHPILDGVNTELCPGGANTYVFVGGGYGDYMKCGNGYLAAGNIILHDFDANIAYPITSDRVATSINNGNGCWMSGAGFKEAWRTSKFATVDGQGSYNVDWPNHGTYYINGFRCNYQMKNGDSGGPVYYDNGAMGIMTAIGSGFTVNSFTDYGFISQAMGLKLCLNSNCTN
jgi:hypothetical protein